MQMERDIFIFSYKDNLMLLFSQGVNSIRGHESSLLVLRTCFRGDETIYI